MKKKKELSEKVIFHGLRKTSFEETKVFTIALKPFVVAAVERDLREYYSALYDTIDVEIEFPIEGTIDEQMEFLVKVKKWR